MGTHFSAMHTYLLVHHPSEGQEGYVAVQTQRQETCMSSTVHVLVLSNLEREASLSNLRQAPWMARSVGTHVNNDTTCME